MKQVVIETTPQEEVLLNDVDTSKGYVMSGNKADYILSKDTEGNFIWVRVTPGKIAKPVHKYSTLKDAIKDKLDRGYDVFEYSDVEFLD